MGVLAECDGHVPPSQKKVGSNVHMSAAIVILRGAGDAAYNLLKTTLDLFEDDSVVVPSQIRCNGPRMARPSKIPEQASASANMLSMRAVARHLAKACMNVQCTSIRDQSEVEL